MKKYIWESDLSDPVNQQEIMNQFKNAMHNVEKFLIMTDLDGTLLDDNCEISATTKEVVQLLKENGHVFCIATGRPWRSSSQYYEQLNLSSLIANLNGSVIFNPCDPQMTPIKYVFSINILKNLCKDPEIMHLIENIIVEDGHDLRIYKKLDKKHIECLSKWFHVDLNKDKPLYGFEELFQANRTIPSILIQISTKIDIDTVVTLIKAKLKTLTCQLWSLNEESHILEINTVFANKGNSLNFFSSFYGIAWDKTLTFGDGYNDVTLISKAHYGYAMKNGKSTAKFVARGVTKFDNNNDGVARKIQEFFIKRSHERSPNYRKNKS